MNKSKLYTHFDNFVKKRSYSKEEYVRLVAFLIGTALLILFMLLHIVGSIGLELPFLRAISWALLLNTTAVVGLYLRNRLALTQAFAIYSITAQLLESARIVYLTVRRPPDFETMILGNQIGSYTILLYLALGFVPKVPVYVTAISLITLFFTALYDGDTMSYQMVILFTLLSVFTCLLAHISQRELHNIQQERHNYQTTYAAMLKAFRMKPRELDIYLQLCNTKNPNEQGKNLLFEQLDEESKHNLIQAVQTLKSEHDAECLDLAKMFPALSGMEQEVCRLVVAGKTLNEIACITGKSVSNISTVRGNVRKKLGLETGTDLRKYLTNACQRKSGTNK